MVVVVVVAAGLLLQHTGGTPAGRRRDARATTPLQVATKDRDYATRKSCTMNGANSA